MQVSLSLRLSVTALAFIAHANRTLAQGDVSPLQTVMDGRNEAANSALTEQGFRGLSQGAVNATLYICGALSVILVAYGLYQLYQAQEEQNAMMTGDDKRRAAVWSIVIGGLISIPAIIAAIAPVNLLGAGS